MAFSEIITFKNFFILQILIFNFVVIVLAKTCHTQSCQDLAFKIQERMDSNVEPCDDFYQFVCGNYSKNAIIEDPDAPYVDAMSLITDNVQSLLRKSLKKKISFNSPNVFHKLKLYYKVCKDTARIEKFAKDEMNQILKELGGWPMIETEWDESNFNWTETMIKFRKKGFFFNSLIDLTVSLDERNTSRYLLNLGQSKTVREHQFDFSRQIDLSAIALGFDLTNETDTVLVVDFHKSLNEIALSNDELEREDVNYNPMTITELQIKFPYFSWLGYINAILEPHKTLTSDDYVNVIGPSYFQDLGNILESFSKRIIANYVFGWLVLQSSEMWSNKVDHYLKFSGNYFERKKRSEINDDIDLDDDNSMMRWQQCLTLANDRLPLAVGALFVREHVKSNDNQSQLKIVNDLFQSFRKILKNADWMDEKTRMTAMEKLNHMVPLLGYPVELLDDDKLDNYHKNITINPKSFLQSELSINRFIFDSQFKSINEPINVRDWATGLYGIAAAVVNAFNSPQLNAIVSPPVMMQAPFFDTTYPKYMNYAGFGSIIGHEMMHCFDTTGIKYDENGNSRDWWDRETKEKFLAEVKCLIDQYSDYTFKENNRQLDGEKSQCENIADNAGLKISYFAYQSWNRRHPKKDHHLSGLEKYSNDQMFWISFAHNFCVKYSSDKVRLALISNDVHAPNEYRVIGSITNSPEFSRDFNCSKGSPMNPIKKCRVW